MNRGIDRLLPVNARHAILRASRHSSSGVRGEIFIGAAVWRIYSGPRGR